MDESNVPNSAPGRLSRAEFLRTAGPFYHVTTEASWTTIQSEGLDPDCCDREKYELVTGKKDGMVFLARQPELAGTVRMIRSYYSGQSVVVLEVSADVVAVLRVELDHTSDAKAFFERREGTAEFEPLVTAGVPLACFDRIPAHALTYVRTYPAAGGPPESR